MNTINLVQIFLTTVVAMFINILFPFFMYIKLTDGNKNKLPLNKILCFIVLPELLILFASILAILFVVLKSLGLC